MPKRFSLATKGPSRVAITVGLMLAAASPASANDEGIPTEMDTLHLADGRVIRLLRISQHETKMWLEKGSGGRRQVIWTKVFEQEYEGLWDQAFFVPVRPGRYIVDVDRDGTPEIGVATWDGGNYFYGYGLLFSVKKRSIKYFGRSQKLIDLVAPTSIYSK